MYLFSIENIVYVINLYKPEKPKGKGKLWNLTTENWLVHIVISIFDSLDAEYENAQITWTFYVTWKRFFLDFFYWTPLAFKGSWNSLRGNLLNSSSYGLFIYLFILALWFFNCYWIDIITRIYWNSLVYSGMCRSV